MPPAPACSSSGSGVVSLSQNAAWSSASGTAKPLSRPAKANAAPRRILPP